MGSFGQVVNDVRNALSPSVGEMVHEVKEAISGGDDWVEGAVKAMHDLAALSEADVFSAAGEMPESIYDLLKENL